MNLFGLKLGVLQVRAEIHYSFCLFFKEQVNILKVVKHTYIQSLCTTLQVSSFRVIRADTDLKKTQIKICGRLCMGVNTRWATNFTIRESVSTKHLELMKVSFRTHYLPHEFGQITVIQLCVPGPKFSYAAERISDSYNEALNKSADQPVFLTG